MKPNAITSPNPKPHSGESMISQQTFSPH